jgi:hypothetical protein
MSRRTTKDKAFARVFGQRLEQVFQKQVKDKDNANRVSVEEFARSLNLTRAGLHKAKKGKSMPGLDLIERARQYGVHVGYGDIPIEFVKQKGRGKSLPEVQLYLPFAVDNLKKDCVSVELGEHKDGKVEVKVWIEFAG